MKPLQRQSSSDFVLVDETPVHRVIVSNNDKNQDFVLIHESPVSRRRQLRGSKELSAEEAAELLKFHQVEDVVIPANDFVLIHESPVTKRRSLRSSKELHDDERHELSVSLEKLTTKAEVDVSEDEDEVGVTVTPIIPPRKSSFRNGRRVSEPSCGNAAIRPQESPQRNSANLNVTTPSAERVPDKTGKQVHNAGPESPTSVAVDAFFGDMLKNSGSNLLAGL